MKASLKIHETATPDGRLAATFLVVEDGAQALVSEDGTSLLPEGAVDAVMARYGAPLEPEERVGEVARLDLGGGRALRHVRHLAGWDVIARDWLVYERPGREAVAALAITVAGALAHLARAAREA